jgi:hypothetical protein
MSLFFKVLHDSIEGRASLTSRDTHGVHVQLDGNNTALPPAAHLLCHVEHKC